MARNTLSPDRLDEVGAYASGRVALVELRERLAAVLATRVALPDELRDDIADELARVALRTMGGFLARTAAR